MAQNTDVTLPAGVWTQISDGDVTALRVQNIGSGAVIIKARVGAGSIPSRAGGICLDSLDMVSTTSSLEELFPGISGATRLYGYSDTGGIVSVSQA